MLTVIFGNLVICHCCAVQNCWEGRCHALMQLQLGMWGRRPGAGADGGLVCFCFGRTVPSLALSSSGTVLPVGC